MMPFSEETEPFIIGQDDRVTAVYKPCGWHSVCQTKSDHSIVSWLYDQGIPRLRESKMDQELGLIYRLDQMTSGILLFAANPQSLEELRQAQKELAIVKRYILISTFSECELLGSLPGTLKEKQSCLIEELFSKREAYIESYFRPYGPKGASVSCIAAEFASKSKKPITKEIYVSKFIAAYRMIEESNARLRLPNEAVCLEVEIRKGFRHQIRAHCAWIGLPILGDMLYGGQGSNRLWLEAFSVCLPQADRCRNEWKLYNGIQDIAQVSPE
jgi:23S rRNA pseudouridine1911/1915/1917 synthase